jgi:hypothetical protein
MHHVFVYTYFIGTIRLIGPIHGFIESTMKVEFNLYYSFILLRVEDATSCRNDTSTRLKG